MDHEEQRLQRRGYVSAITSNEVLEAISSGLTGRIAVAYVEWAGAISQFLTVDWVLIDSRESAAEMSALASSFESSGLFTEAKATR